LVEAITLSPIVIIKIKKATPMETAKITRYDFIFVFMISLPAG
jgi:hypothetical protein